MTFGSRNWKVNWIQDRKILSCSVRNQVQIFCTFPPGPEVRRIVLSAKRLVQNGTFLTEGQPYAGSNSVKCASGRLAVVAVRHRNVVGGPCSRDRKGRPSLCSQAQAAALAHPSARTSDNPRTGDMTRQGRALFGHKPGKLGVMLVLLNCGEMSVDLGVSRTAWAKSTGREGYSIRKVQEAKGSEKRVSK
jgi:hypothetical protein